jgi:galactoside O-acetyltransferase
MLASLRVLASAAIAAARRLSMRRRAYRSHGLLLPAGAVLNDAEHMKIGRGLGLSEQCMLFCQDPERGSRLEIGEDVGLNVGVMLNADCGGSIVIGNRVLIGPYAVIRAANHRMDATGVPILQQGHKPGVIVIEDDVWLGAHVTVLPDVRIGRGAVIGAGSVVSRDVPAGAIAAGSPATVLRYRGDK